MRLPITVETAAARCPGSICSPSLSPFPFGACPLAYTLPSCPSLCDGVATGRPCLALGGLVPSIDMRSHWCARARTHGASQVMGHEMTHGFDDTGAFFDAHRQMRQWWSSSSALHFSERAHCIQTLYSGLEIANARVRGDATMGENIADFGGLKVAYKAFLAYHRDGERENGDGGMRQTAPLRDRCCCVCRIRAE